MDNLYSINQSHGIFWENEIKNKVFQLPINKNDNRKYDIEAHENIFNQNENISIKTSGKNKIDCGDIPRFYDDSNFNQKYTIIVILYKQNDLHKEFKKIIEINYDIIMRNFLFGTISNNDINQYVSLVKNIPHGNISNSIKLEYLSKKKNLQIEHQMFIKISPKVDSNKQRRVQCSINNLDELLLKFPQNIIYMSESPIVRNINITEKIYSPPRLRNPKVKI